MSSFCYFTVQRTNDKILDSDSNITIESNKWSLNVAIIHGKFKKKFRFGWLDEVIIDWKMMCLILVNLVCFHPDLKRHVFSLFLIKKCFNFRHSTRTMKLVWPFAFLIHYKLCKFIWTPIHHLNSIKVQKRFYKNATQPHLIKLIA